MVKSTVKKSTVQKMIRQVISIHYLLGSTKDIFFSFITQASHSHGQEPKLECTVPAPLILHSAVDNTVNI